MNTLNALTKIVKFVEELRDDEASKCERQAPTSRHALIAAMKAAK